MEARKEARAERGEGGRGRAARAGSRGKECSEEWLEKGVEWPERCGSSGLGSGWLVLKSRAWRKAGSKVGEEAGQVSSLGSRGGRVAVGSKRLSGSGSRRACLQNLGQEGGKRGREDANELGWSWARFWRPRSLRGGLLGWPSLSRLLDGNDGFSELVAVRLDTRSALPSRCLKPQNSQRTLQRASTFSARAPPPRPISESPSS